LGAEGDKCVIVVGDVGTAEGAGDVITEAVLRLGGLDALVVSGASTSSPPPDFFENSDPSSFADWARVHWLSKMYCTHHALPHLRQSNDASIVYLSTDGGRFPTVGESFACGAAAALHMMTRTLALEFKRHKVRVNTVATTAMLGTPGLDVDLGGAKKVFEKALRRQALPLEPIDVAEAVAYLSSRAARSITGQILSVNGGTSTGL
jgi:3-oxoacyl-[acyl-carrier protein] reductase